MKKLNLSVGVSLAFLLTVALASPVFACGGDRDKDKTEGDSAVQVEQDLAWLACDGDQHKDKEGDSVTTDSQDV